MTWRKWWALEVLLGICFVVDVYPLILWRFAAAVFLNLLFSYCYLNRVIGQHNR